MRSLLDAEAQHRSELGGITRLTADTVPILRGLSIKRLTLAPGSIRALRWHADADEIGYCLAGHAMVSILDDGSVFSSFTIEAGQMSAIAEGSLHHFENIGDDEVEIDLPSSDLTPLTRDTTSPDIVKRDGPAMAPDTAGFGHPHKLDVGAQNPPFQHPFASRACRSSTHAPRPRDAGASVCCSSTA